MVGFNVPLTVICPMQKCMGGWIKAHRDNQRSTELRLMHEAGTVISELHDIIIHDQPQKALYGE